MVGRVDTFNHTLDVVEEVSNIASQFNLNKDKCIKAAYLHDIGRVVSEVDLSILCSYFGTDITRDEELLSQYYIKKHQK
jgi:putative nucleotidyltransferase with HDIG domain